MVAALTPSARPLRLESSHHVDAEVGMRGLSLALVTLLLLSPSATAQENAARAVIDKAIQAQGGLDTLVKAEAGYRKLKGVFKTDNFHFTGESYSDDGNRLKITLRGTDSAGEVRMLVMVGTKGWSSFNGSIFEFDAKQQARMRRASHADKVAGLVALVREPGFNLTVLGDSMVAESAAVGVKVQVAGMPDMQLWFDKGTGLLVKTRYPVIDADNEQEVMQEVYYSKFELFDPAAQPLQELQTAKADVTGPGLLKFLSDRIPDKEERIKIQLLIAELGRTSYAAREKASAGLQKLGAKAAAYLRLALKSDDGEVVRRAEKLLEQVASSHELAWLAAVVRLLAVRRPPGTAEALLAYYPWACDDAADRETLFALTSLVEVDAKAKGVVETALGDADLKKRAAAEMVLGKDGGKFLKQPGRRVVLEGIRFARVARIFRSGQLHFEMETFDHQFYNRFDDSLFARP
jgi:hypothetical protein